METVVLTPPCQMITNRCDLFTSRIIIGWDLEERKRYFNRILTNLSEDSETEETDTEAECSGENKTQTSSANCRRPS
jgi:hypothetical protein